MQLQPYQHAKHNCTCRDFRNIAFILQKAGTIATGMSSPLTAVRSISFKIISNIYKFWGLECDNRGILILPDATYQNMKKGKGCKVSNRI